MGSRLSRKKTKSGDTAETSVKLSRVGRRSYDDDKYTMRNDSPGTDEVEVSVRRRAHSDTRTDRVESAKNTEYGAQPRPERGNPSRSHDSEDGDVLQRSSRLTTTSTDSAYSDRSAARASRIYEESKLFPHMVEAFQPLIERSVNVMEVLPHLHFIDDTETFRNLSRESPPKAVARLIETIEGSKDPGRWQTFLEALERTGYSYIVTLLKGKTQEDSTIQRKLLQLFTPKLIHRIDPEEFLDHLYSMDVIGDEDKEEIRCEHQNRGPIAASLMLLDRVPRKVTGWFDMFIRVLKECDLEDCVKDLDEDASRVRTAPALVTVSSPLEETAMAQIGTASDITNLKHIATPSDVTVVSTVGKTSDVTTVKNVLSTSGVVAATPVVKTSHNTAVKRVVSDFGKTATQSSSNNKTLTDCNTTLNTEHQTQVNQDMLTQLKRNQEMMVKLNQNLLVESSEVKGLRHDIDMVKEIVASHDLLVQCEAKLMTMCSDMKQVKGFIEKLAEDIAIMKEDMAILKKNGSRPMSMSNGDITVVDVTHF